MAGSIEQAVCHHSAMTCTSPRMSATYGTEHFAHTLMRFNHVASFIVNANHGIV
jgi:hypothetical protein